jgi:sirohydrochlorin cobaltochelatase
MHALILFAHGARDARWSLTLGELARRVAARRPETLVLQAFLEFQSPDLAAGRGARGAAGDLGAAGDARLPGGGLHGRDDAVLISSPRAHRRFAPPDTRGAPLAHEPP